VPEPRQQTSKPATHGDFRAEVADRAGGLVSNVNTLLELLQVAPDRDTAAILPESGIRVTYSSLREQVLAMADALAAAGIERGHRVAIVLPNGLPSIVSFLAASIAGTAAPLNSGYRQEEFSFYLEDTAARVLLCPPDGAEEARKAAAGKVPVHAVQMDETGFVRLVGAPQNGHGGNGHSVAPPQPDDIALVLHTSGSTGRPKRVPLRHKNLAASAHNIVKTYDLSPADVSLCAMPLFHVHGLVASTIATLLSGGAVLVPGKFSPLSFWRIVRENRVTWYSAVPTIHQLLLSRSGGERPAGAEGLRFIRSCSASLSPEMMLALEGAFGVPVLEAYGMTEASHQMCSNPLPPNARKPGSVGPGTGVGVSIMDAKGKHLAPGERGEVVIQGPNVVTEYENNPEANATSFTDGWFRTGDQGFLDADGYLTLTGRIKELINRGGEKIAPREIDEVLLRHPDVAEAVAFGVPHAAWGEEVAAAVVLREPQSESAILAFCRQHLAEFKCPKNLYIVTAIPRTATGKIQRGVVAATLAGAKK
jgi:acyl-CoA synthetase (AMP-forming)/AMP-acid ligase II